MAWLGTIVSYGLYLILLLSLAAVVLFAAFLWRRARQDPEAWQPRMLAAYAAGATSFCSLVVALINLIHPIGMLPPRDPGIVAIERWFQALSQKRWNDAIALLHPDRIAELKKGIPDFGTATLKTLYEPLVGYDNLKIRLTLEGVHSKTYSVAVDAEESWPQNAFFIKQERPMQDFFDQGLLNEDRLLAAVLENLKGYYVVPDAAIPTVRRTLATRKLESLFSPAFTYELHRNLKFEENLELSLKSSQAPLVTAKRHFVFNLRVAEDNGWRIRAGLADPPLIAPYRQRSPWAR